MIIEYGAMHRLMGVIGFGALVVLTLQGLRNRPGPRWLAITGVLGLILVQQEEMQTGCYSRANGAVSSIWLIAVASLFIHHAIQPRKVEVQRQHFRALQLASQTVNWAFVCVVGTWFAFYEAMAILTDTNPRRAEMLISNVQSKISLPAYVLLLLATALAVYQAISHPKAQAQG